MKLTTSKLPEYFTIASPTNSHYKTETNTFDFVDNNSDTLVVTVGESWTYGADVVEDDNDPARLEHVYGALVAKELKADWLNLGQRGAGNFWIAERVEELSQILSKLNYQQVYVICTFTEPGRSFDSQHDRYIDYITWFKENTPDKFLEFLNTECINRIKSALNTFNNVTLRIGVNFVDPCGFPNTKEFLQKSWIDLIAEKNNFTMTPCYVSDFGVFDLRNARDFFPDPVVFLTWMNDLIDKSSQRYLIIRDKRYFVNMHPYAHDHITWANYILESLNVPVS